MIKRNSSLLVLLLATLCSAQVQMVRLSVRAVLVDNDLNQKPVPRLALVVKRVDGDSASETTIKTGFDGLAELKLAPGKYRITTPQPIDFQGKRYSWEQEVVLSSAEQTLELSNDNALTTASSPGAPASENLNKLFERFKNAVVSVQSELGNGSGFFVDSAGLIVTNNHVVESSNYLAVQFDEKHKVRAQLLAASPEKDIAVLRVNPAAFPKAVIAALAATETDPLKVGDQVFTIGNPLGREKVLTTGVISKIAARSITSDININHGNSGGPLFSLKGQVLGITTSGLEKLASMIPIQDARPVIEQARTKISGSPMPSADLLPVMPTEYFPAAPLSALLQTEKLDEKPYFLDAGEFKIWFSTPQLSYFGRHQREMSLNRKAAKRDGSDPSQIKPETTTLEEANEYRPVLMISVLPKFSVVWRVKFKNGFQRMRLLCGGKEVLPITPGRWPYELRDVRGRAVDKTYEGRYLYAADAVSPACGNVVLEIFSEKESSAPVTRMVDSGTIERVWADFEPYRKAQTEVANTEPKKQ